MSSTSKGDKHTSNESGRGGKLARRARSFKEDFLDILSQMRSPSSSGGGSGLSSPKPPRSPKPRTSSSSDTSHEDRNPLADLDTHVRQVQNALKHFKDVVSKNKLEVLPGNGTVVLESIATIHSLLKTYFFIEQSTTLVSATNQVYQSLATLIKLCDDVLLGGEKALNKQNVTEVLQQVEEAVQNLVSVASGKIAERGRQGRGSSGAEKRGSFPCEAPLRNSLPDIPLTPRERQILEQTSQAHPQGVHSTESITDTPPPKPPLPTTRVWLGESPPPLPPKRKGQGPPSHSMERLSLRSDTSSLGSLDSMLNTSSRDDEVHALMDDDTSTTLPDNSLLSHGIGSIVNGSQTGSCCWDSSCSNFSDHTHLTESPEPPPVTISTTGSKSFLYAGCFGTSERSSMSSGFVSMRNSSQSYSYSLSKCNAVSYSSTTESKQVGTTVLSSSSSSSMRVQQERSATVSTVVDGPPALPLKKSRRERQPSQYDNVLDSHLMASAHPINPSDQLSSSPDNKPPPLPIKKKYIMAYMEMFGNCSQPSTSELLRHSVHTYSLLQAEWQRHDEVTLSSTQSCSFNMVTHSTNSSQEGLERRGSPNSGAGLPPALPPKRSKVRPSVTPPPQEPTPPPPAPLPLVQTPVSIGESIAEPVEIVAVTNGSYSIPEGSPLYDLDVSSLLVFKKAEEEGPDIRGGHPDALVIHATKASKNDFLYQEAFLTTYRTFLSPLELIEKLCARHQRFICCPDAAKQRAAREAFSLLVRLVSDLTISDLDPAVLQNLMDFVYQLLCRGELSMAKALRVKILERHNAKQQILTSQNSLLPAQNIYTRQSSLMEFKSEQVAEQMTLLDSELFMKIEIPEVLIWAQEQNEERSPNLTQFTEHFNKMSYWARSRILEQTDAKDRERYVIKFIKIMKHLRKINNFNSYLALLSALDSAPIRRLEWQKHITEGLKEYCALIDSSSSFRAYRQALAETQPPCIPYIGLVLQDLTFVHIGNSDSLTDGIINFSKRWQQFNIVENMKRFKKGTYNFKKNERIIAFFNNFDEFLCEEAMWQISESIKPRGSKKSNQ